MVGKIHGLVLGKSEDRRSPESRDGPRLVLGGLSGSNFPCPKPIQNEKKMGKMGMKAIRNVIVLGKLMRKPWFLRCALSENLVDPPSG